MLRAPSSEIYGLLLYILNGCIHLCSMMQQPVVVNTTSKLQTLPVDNQQAKDNAYLGAHASLLIYKIWYIDIYGNWYTYLSVLGYTHLSSMSLLYLWMLCRGPCAEKSRLKRFFYFYFWGSYLKEQDWIYSRTSFQSEIRKKKARIFRTYPIANPSIPWCC